MTFSLALAMLLFTASRIAFYLFNTDFFPGMTISRFLLILWGGLHFDLTAVLYTNALFIALMIVPFKFRFTGIYKTALKIIFFLFNGIALAATNADIIYYRFTLRRTTATIFSEFKNETNLWSLIPRFIFDYWYVTLFFIFLTVLMATGYNRLKFKGPRIKNPFLFYITGVLAIPLVAVLFIGGVRGDFKNSTRPITLGNAGEYVSEARDVNIVLNTPFAVYRTLQQPVIPEVHYFKSEYELENVFTPVHSGSDRGFRKKNVIIIILESFGREYFGIYNKDLDSVKYKGFTPFLDSLAGASKPYFDGFANGRESMDAPVSVLASIPALYNISFSKSPYSINEFNGLGQLLKNTGYHTSFFHGGHNGTMNFNSFVKNAGYEYYFGKDEYEMARGTNDYDGYWGIWDEKFFQFFAGKLSAFPQPFHTVIFSVTSHSPFVIPKQYKDTFEEEELPIYKTIRYTDYCLKKFFHTVSKMNWFHNTLFVITADHCSAQTASPRYRTRAGYFMIPVIFFSPGDSLKGMEFKIAQQIDIMPSVLGYLNYGKDYFAFGRNLFSSSEEEFAFNYLDNLYQLFMGDYLLLFDGEKAVALYQFKKDMLLAQNIMKENSEVAGRMIWKAKAFIQQYNNRMVQDRLTLKKDTVILPEK